MSDQHMTDPLNKMIRLQDGDSYGDVIPSISGVHNFGSETKYDGIRDLLAWTADAECRGCGESSICLYSDGSDMEYQPVALCYRCVAELFKTQIRKSK